MPLIWLDNNQDIEDSGLTGNSGAPWLCKLVSYDDGLVTLKIDADRDTKPIKEGVICLSMHGYRKMRERRLKAVATIQQRSNPMPQLHYLLEGTDVPFDKRRTVKALTPAALGRFKGKPTSKQKEALKVALNTPDVAIVIGPPGTGKTQVITALQVRLAEELKDLPVQHQMLISSFQHDAVDNVMERSNVFGLPAIKVGGKRKKSGEQYSNPISSWCTERAGRLDKTLGCLLESEPAFGVVQALQKSLTILRVSKPDFKEKCLLVNQIVKSLHKLANEHQIRLSPQLQHEWQSWKGEYLSSGHKSDQQNNDFLLRRVRALRTTHTAYEDDGLLRCGSLLDAFEKTDTALLPEDQTLLTELCAKNTASAEDINKLKTLKNSLLDQLLPDFPSPTCTASA